jgi:hypothetical protein
VVLQIEENAFDVADALLKHPQFVVGRGQVVENAYNEFPLDGLTTAGSVLENLLALIEKDQSLLECSHVDLLPGLVVDGLDLVDEGV